MRLRAAMRPTRARSQRSGCCAGMINGQLLRKVMANSPGGILADSSQGQPPIFISAGLQDNIFPIQQAGNAVRPATFLDLPFVGWDTLAVRHCTVAATWGA